MYVRLVWLGVVAVVACKRSADDRHEPPPAPPAVAVFGLAPGPPPVLAPPPRALPPPAAGYVRFPYYDVDVKLPDAAHASLYGHGAVQFGGGCTLSVYASSHDAVAIGTLMIECLAGGRTPDGDERSDCALPCKTLVAVAGGTAEDPSYPREEPVLEIDEEHDDDDGIATGSHLWSDGTVQFFGPTCPRWRGRRGTLSRERVAAILVALERTGVLAYSKLEQPSCEDGVETHLVVRARGKEAKLMQHDCAAHPDPAPVPHEAIAIAHAALGANACGAPPRPPSPLAKAPPAELVPESATAAAFPSEAPAIKWDGNGVGDLEIWLDGSVRYSDGECRTPRRGKLPPERVAALLAALDQRGELDAGIHADDLGACCDCRHHSLELRLGDKRARLIAPGCNYPSTYGYKDAYALVTEVVGNNPCAPPP